MFSTRTIIWVVLVIFLLPADEKGKKELYHKANTAVSYVQQACNSVEICESFDPSWATFTKKAQTGADLIADLIESNQTGEAMPMQAQASSRSYLPTDYSRPMRLTPQANNPKNTLEISDLIPVWREPHPNSYASR